VSIPEIGFEHPVSSRIEASAISPADPKELRRRHFRVGLVLPGRDELAVSEKCGNISYGSKNGANGGDPAHLAIPGYV
jgi:hypothetical protein